MPETGGWHASCEALGETLIAQRMEPMTDPEPINKLKLAALLCAALVLVISLVPGPRWVAAMETASFRLSLSVNSEPVRFRTVPFDSEQSRLSLNFERRR